MPSAAVAKQFLAQKRIAVLGVSRDSKAFANALFRALRERGYEAIPVNPHAPQLEGVDCYPTVQAITDPVKAALLLLPAAATEGAVRDCLAAGVEMIWIQSASGPSAATPSAKVLAKQADCTLIDGGCPFMFLEGAGWFHRLHGTIAHWTGDVTP